MERLVFKYKVQTTIKISVLVLLILLVVLAFALSGWSVKLADMAKIFLLILLWVFMFFIRSSKSRIGTCDNCLKVKWTGWLREIIVRDTEIEKIILSQLFVSIYRIGKKPVRLALESLEKTEKTRIYEFLIDYSKQKNIVLERHLNP